MKKGSKRKRLTAILSVIVLTCGSLAGCGSPVTESNQRKINHVFSNTQVAMGINLLFSLLSF